MKNVRSKSMDRKATSQQSQSFSIQIKLTSHKNHKGLFNGDGRHDFQFYVKNPRVRIAKKM